MTDSWTPYERIIGFRLNAFLWINEERAAYVESRRYRWSPKIFSEASVAHLADVTGIIRWPKMPKPERVESTEEVLGWLKKEFGR